MRASSAKAKGRRLQQQVAQDLLKAFGEQLGPDDVRSCPMGSHGCDVQLSTAARRCVPWSIECKNQERLNLREAFQQAEANCSPGTAPVVVSKRNREEPLCTLRWADAVELLCGAVSDSARRERSGDLDLLPPARILRRLADRLEKSASPEDNADAAAAAAAAPE